MNQKQSQPVKVNLTIQPDGPGAGWHMDVVGGGKGGPGNYPKIDIPKNASSTPFKFQITGNGTQGVTFAAADPIWVAPDNGTGSPKTAGVDAQITNVAVTQGGKTLTFTNLNTSAGDLTYQLNFVGAKPLDPIIHNGGGGGGIDPEIATYALLVGLAVLAAIVFAAFRARSRRESPTDQPG